MSGFSNPIIGGGGALVYPQIMSPNFNLAAETGWAILKNGSAYFFNITADGTITATAFIGTDFEIQAEGAFFYSGTPMAGNPPVAWLTNGAATVDPFGNALANPAPGLTTIAAPGGGLFSQMTAGQIQFGDTLSAEALTALATIVLIHSGSTGASPVLAIDSPAADANATHSTLWLLGYPEVGGAPPAQAALFAGFGHFTPVPVEFILCGTLAFGAVFGGLPTPGGATISADASGNLDVVPAAGKTVLVAPSAADTPATADLLEVQGAVGLVNTAAPASVATAAQAYANSGQLQYIGADGNSYDAGRLTQYSTGTTLINSTSGIAINGLTFAQVGALTYRVHGRIKGIISAAGVLQAQTIRFSGTATVSSMDILVSVAEQTNNATISPGSITALNSDPASVGPAWNLGVTVDWTFDGVVTFSAAGTFIVQGRNVTATGDTSYTVQVKSFCDLMPVVA
jgi:hypothetical protein